MFNDNIILNTDSYKLGHFMFEPRGTTSNYAYIEARPTKEFEYVQFFGLQYFIKEYLMKPITQEMIDEAEEQVIPHGLPFNRRGWEYILAEHDGYIPVRICALPEGVKVRHGIPQVTVESTDENCPWVAAYIETAILRAVWYPSTVATRSNRWLNTIKQYTDDVPASMKVVDFGARGVQSTESAALGGAAHLINFEVTDNQLGIRLLRKYYGADMPGYSIPATEHSVTTSWTKEGELDFYQAILDRFGQGEGDRQPVSVVIDSYDQEEALRMWGEDLKMRLIASNMTLIARPDSGDPITNPIKVIHTLMKYFGWAVNGKGYRVLPEYVRVIQGDGINEENLGRLCKQMASHKLSLDNLSLGSGGGLLQADITRDTHRYAQKSSEVVVDGKTREIQKLTPGKESKAGRVAVVQDLPEGVLRYVPEAELELRVNMLQPVYENGELLRDMTLDDVKLWANM